MELKLVRSHTADILYTNVASSTRLKLKHVQQLLSLFESLLTLLFCLFQWENKGLALLFCILQYLAMTWYVNDICLFNMNSFYTELQL